MNRGIKYRQPYHAGVGATSVIMIFVVLCLTALGILGLSRARSGEKTARISTQYACQYYEAQAQAQAWLAQAHDDAAAGKIASGETITQTFQMNDEQALYVEARARADGGLDLAAHAVTNADGEAANGAALLQ